MSTTIDVDAGVNELLDTFFRTAADGDSSAGEQLAVSVLGSDTDDRLPW